MAEETKKVELKGRVFITFELHAATGLHIGGSETGIEIGGVDKAIIRDPLTNRPYVPGSSLKGKVRSLLEKRRGLAQNKSIGNVHIHSCEKTEDYAECPVCTIFGVPGDKKFSTPTRLVVRDVHLNEESADRLVNQAHTDMPYTEVKTEVAIDRVTSAALPRQMERVPAGSVFSPAELVYSLYALDGGDVQQDVENLAVLLEGLKLLEDDYLGGLGTRGSGKVRLKGIAVTLLRGDNYLADPQPVTAEGEPYPDLAALVADHKALLERIATRLG